MKCRFCGIDTRATGSKNEEKIQIQVQGAERPGRYGNEE